LADALPASGPEAVALFAMALAAHVAALQQQQQVASPSTPSGMVPVHEKPSVGKGKGGRRKRPGAKDGHPGTRRKPPATIDAREEHRLDVCPCCGGELQRCRRTRTRVIEDIPAEITPLVTEHTIHRDYCPSCKRHVEPVVPDAMPNATLGHHVMALSSWFHYGLGVTIGQTRDILASHLHTAVTAGGLVDGWRRLAETLFPWYEQVGRDARDARAGAVPHADETGWRVDGQTRWLWCFCTADTCCYLIDPSRGSAALQRFFVEAFRGVLVTDFWAAYDAVCAGDNQGCLPHLLRELVKVDEHNDGREWRAFSKQLKRLVRDGIRLRKRPDFSKERYASRIRLIHRRLCTLADAAYPDADAARLGERISKYRDQLFTFLDTAGVPPDNNHGERQIRPAVITGGDHPQEQPVQPQRAGRRHAGGADEHLPHAEAPRPGPDANDRRGVARAAGNRETTAAAGESCCGRVKCYPESNRRRGVGMAA
jgi:transposase